MATKLFEDETQATYLGPNGSPLTVAKGPFGGQDPFGMPGPALAPEPDQTSILNAPPVAAFQPEFAPPPLPLPPPAISPGPVPLSAPVPGLDDSGIVPEETPAPAPQGITPAEVAGAVAQADPRELVARAGVANAQAADAANQQINEGYQRTEEATAKIAADKERIRVEREADLVQRRDTLEKQHEDELKKEPNPDRWWESQSGGTKALALISMALSGIGNAMMGKGGQNEALQIIQGRVDKDVKLQMGQKRDRLDRIGVQRQGLAEDKQDLQNQLASYDQMAAQEWKKYEVLTRRVADTTKNEQVKANALVAAGQFNQQYKEHADRVAHQQEALEQQDKASRRSAWVSRSNARDARTEQARQFDAGLAIKAQDQGLGHINAAMDRLAKNKTVDPSGPLSASDPASVRTVLGDRRPIGRLLNPGDKEGSRNYKLARVARENFISEMTVLRDMAKKSGAVYGGPGSRKFMASEAGQKIQSQHARIMAKFRKQMSGAQVSDKEMADFLKIVPEPETWTTVDPAPAWENISRAIAEEQEQHDVIHLAPHPDYRSPVESLPVEESKIKSMDPQAAHDFIRQPYAPYKDPTGEKTLTARLSAFADQLSKIEAPGDRVGFVKDVGEFYAGQVRETESEIRKATAAGEPAKDIATLVKRREQLKEFASNSTRALAKETKRREKTDVNYMAEQAVNRVRGR